MEQFCEYCNEPFEPKRSDALYCSPGCRQLAYVLRKAQNNPISKDLNYPSIRLAGEQDFTDEDQEPSRQILQKLNYPSIMGNEDSDNTKNLSVNTDNMEEEKPFIDYESAFLNEIKFLIDKREDNLEFFREDENQECEWINIRYRCLIESLLTLSEMQTVNLEDLKEICNAFTSMIRSRDYDCIHEYYPYLKDIESLWQSLKKICLEADEEQPLVFKLKRSTKLNLIVTRWELSHFARKENFNQLNFKD